MLDRSAQDFADFEISLHRVDQQSYAIQLRFRQAGTDADTRLIPDCAPLRFDSEDLVSVAYAPVRYGRALWNILFGDAGVVEAFKNVRAMSGDAPIRLRLMISPNAAELHKLRWESLCDPADNSPLLTGQRILFSRYLTSSDLDWRPVQMRARSELRALAVAANPDLSSSPSMKPVKAEQEIERARKALGRIPMDAICTRGEATLSNIEAALRDGYDILYLICHGSFSGEESRLWLEDERGNVHRVSGRELVSALKRLRKLPRLIVLASCESAGEGEGVCGDDRGSLAAVGPSLAEAGVPAVIAMQGQVSMKTVEIFMESFFDELRKDGQVDAAMSVARGKVTASSQLDWWMPVLYSRLISGRLWYEAGFLGDERGEGAKKWPAVLSSIRDQECTAIVGPGLGEALFGSRSENAVQLAEEYRFPLGPLDGEDLGQVAQYVAVDQSPKELQKAFVRRLLSIAKERHGDKFPEALQTMSIDKASIEEVLDAVRALSRSVFSINGRSSVVEEYRVLAKLPFRLYISTDPTDLLSHALEEAGRKPRQLLCPWNKHTARLTASAKSEPGYRPSEAEPLIYQLFGSVNEPKSLVLTVDDHFDYLIGVTSNKDLIPGFIRSALASTSLLFAGVRVEDWDFRVLLRSIAGQEGRSGEDEDVQHIAAQVTPAEGRIRQPARAREYLQSYLQKTAAINIYWGSAEDFLSELRRRWEQKYG